MKEYKLKRCQDSMTGCRTQAQVVRVSDGKDMLSSPSQLAVAKRYVKDMNEKTDMGVYLIEKANSAH